MVEILRSKEQTGPLWWRFSSAIVALYSLTLVNSIVLRNTKEEAVSLHWLDDKYRDTKVLLYTSRLHNIFIMSFNGQIRNL